MIDGLRPFPDYRDSGLPWAARIPAHWAVRRTKAVLQERSDKGFPNEPLLAATQTKGVVRKDQYENRTVLALKDLHLLKLVKEGDFVISLRSFQGGIEYARQQGIISPAYTVLYPVDSENHSYLAWLFKCRPYVEGLSLFVTGIRQGQNVDYERLSRSGLPVPPPNEQAAIVHFLNQADRRIRRYIRAKKELIALLNEQKQGAIHHAVTRGLNQGVPVKPSGVQWLGNVPQHWEVWQVGHFGRVGNGSTPSRGNSAYWSGGSYPWLNSSSVNRSPISGSDQFVTDLALRECHLPRVTPSSVLIAITGQGKTRGTAAVLATEATINQHIAYITPRRDVVSAEYLQLVLVGAYRELRSISEDAGSTKSALTCADISHFKLALPPLDEQTRIIEEVRTATRSLEAAVASNHREIGLLLEYQTRLVADVVTGRLDVREATARLPDEEDATEADNDGEALAEADANGEPDAPASAAGEAEA